MSVRLVVVNIALIIISVVWIIPDLTSHEDELTTENGTLRKTYIETYRSGRRRLFRDNQRKRLVLVTMDRTEREYKLTSKYKRYWPLFQSKESNGKKLRVYLNTNNGTTNPIKVELDNKVVYDKSSIWLTSILIILGTVGLTVYHIYRFIER